MEKYRKEYPESILFNKKDPSLKDLFEASQKNDPAAVIACRNLAVVFSAMIHNINLSFDADTMILLGEYADADTCFLDQLKTELGRFMYYPENYTPDIRLDQTPLDKMLKMGSVSMMLHRYYKERTLYTDEK